MIRSLYEIEHEDDGAIVIRDLNGSVSVTNDAEHVVAQLADRLNGRRLLYFDSDGNLDEIVVRNGTFAGFRVVQTTGRK